MNDEPLDESADEQFCTLLKEILPRYDLVIVADYGHGMLSPRAIDTLFSTPGASAISANDASRLSFKNAACDGKKWSNAAYAAWTAAARFEAPRGASEAT